ncbi:MAG TPA: bifunctional phosphopantothenoylcysteine decarboxylase/phosphopantothenate--cysteine ligase CoaBC, partial [Holophaga sp.]|nr:bifunctional phosphopantothenoylcysteine decarboxylase/phosphopantothenate--cysteine ligase CoaBC [Holophaga sp.]
WADLVAVVPATADILGKTANGLADDLLSTILLAATGKILWAPAMNKAMWAHPAVQANVARLRTFGHSIVEPVEGLLACGDEGAGKLADIEHIAEAIRVAGTPKNATFNGKHVLITAGPTREDLDPVRTLTNRSTGAMGIELARAFRDAGAMVYLVLGGDQKAPWGVSTTRVRSAQDMLDACRKHWPNMDGLIAAAAVADQRPETCAIEKIKKQDGPETLTLVRTPDVLATLATERRPGQWIVGFAAESEQHLAFAEEKLRRKNLDAILVNDIQNGRGFGLQANTLTLVTRQGVHASLGPLPKSALAAAVVESLGEILG